MMRQKNEFISVIIPAAGLGKRMKAKINKQFLQLNEKTILEHTIRKVHSFSTIHEIILVLPKEFIKDQEYLLKMFPKINKIREGGKERQDSVINGLQDVSPKATHIFVHDGVRPFLKEEYFIDLIEELEFSDCVAIGTPVKNTIKIVDSNNLVLETANRDNLWAVQTPQGMKSEAFRSCYSKILSKQLKGTDEAMIAEQCGLHVKIVKGDYDNIKITSPEDLIVAKEILKMQ